MTETKVILADLRQSIDHIDHALMFLLAERSRVIVKVGLLKKQSVVPLIYSERRKADLAHIGKQAVQQGLRAPFIEGLFELIYRYSLTLIEQSEVLPSLDSSDASLAGLQTSLYNLDMAVCHCLAERFQLVLKVGQLKQQHNLPPLDKKRFQALLTEKLNLADSLGLDKSFIESLFHFIHQEALQLEAETT